MKENGSTKLICCLLILAILGSGCASTTVFHTTPANADVYIKGQRLGTTPYSYTDRKIAGASSLITFKKEGYEDYNTTLRRTERWNIPALLSGLILVYPLFWVLGYDQVHSYDLMAEEVTQPVPDTDLVKTEVVRQAVTGYDLADPEGTLQIPSVEELLTQGKIDKAVEYSEKQEEPYQSSCFFTIAQYYLDKGDYSTAEDFYNRSGKVKEGNMKMAESLMRGEVIDSVLAINEEKVKMYLGKVYDNEKDILSKMAVCFEKYATENKERIALTKTMKEMGIIAMSSGGKNVNINKALILSQMQTVFYLTSAVQVYEKLDNVEKAEELKNEIDALKKDFSGELSTAKNMPEESVSKNLPPESDTINLPPESTGMNLTKEDDRIIITVDSIVRTDTQPQDLVTALREAKASLRSRPNKNANYVLVYFHKTEKKALNITKRLPLSPVSLTDDAGKNYGIILERGPSFLRTPGGGELLWNPAAPQPEGVIIKERYMMFIMPQSSAPVRLNYVYNYKDNKDSKKLNTVYWAIDLVQ